MNPGLLIGRGNEQREPGPFEDIGIEASLHGEASTEQTDALQSAGSSILAGGLHDADERDRRSPADLIKDDVRRIGGDRREVCSGAIETLHLLDEVGSQAGQSVRFDEQPHPGEVDAVDDHCRIAAVVFALAPGGDDETVILDRRFRAEAADDPGKFHYRGGVSGMRRSFPSRRQIIALIHHRPSRWNN